MEDPNLLVTFQPREFAIAREELVARLEDLSRPFRLLPSRVRGLFQVLLEADSKASVVRLRQMCLEDPGRFLHTYRWIPVDLWTDSTIEAMRRAVRGLAASIGEEERWKLHVSKRFYDAHTTQEIILLLADEVDNPRVDLESPDVILRVEIIGGRAGLTLHRRNEMLDVNVVRRELGLKAI
jgi:tRNA(Ser,Leu) C12 N-acetylase TAN1